MLHSYGENLLSVSALTERGPEEKREGVNATGCLRTNAAPSKRKPGVVNAIERVSFSWRRPKRIGLGLHISIVRRTTS